MPKQIVDAAFTDGDTAFFFLADQFVVYDYAATPDRVRDGVRALTDFPPGSGSGFPSTFVPTGPSGTLDAGLRGRGPFSDAAYFFRGSNYMRLQMVPPPGVFEPDQPRSISLWKLPRGFSKVGAAFNGALNRDPYAYLFKGNLYVRYVWASDSVDKGYPKEIGTMVGMPAAFAAGVDSAVDGGGPFSDAGYLFKGDNYLRFQWVSGTAEPHVAGPVRPIQGNWLGLAELLLAGKAKSQGLEWLQITRNRLAALSAGTLAGNDLTVMTRALATHFHTTSADTASITQITTMLANVETTLRASATTFRFRTDAEAIADGKPGIDAAYTAPWPPSAGTAINFTRNFKLRAERNRASSVIHEAVHVNDAASAAAAVHIPEWYVGAAEAHRLRLQFVPNNPAFPTRYDAMTNANALHNAASYATFARHLFFGVDNREIA